jgi:GGDEF domain-containing protein
MDIHEVQTSLFAALERYTALSTAYRVLLAEKRNLERALVADPVTGIGTRRAGEEALTAALAHAQRYKMPLTIAIMTLEHLDEQSVVEMAEALSKRLRVGDGLYHWAADEFLILLPFTSLEQADLIMKRAAHSLPVRHRVAEFAGDENYPALIKRAVESQCSLLVGADTTRGAIEVV